jgi:putative PIN family toxin of toxin-antitoxin system
VRVVIDTNVFISGVFFSGPPHQILKTWRDGKVKLAVSGDILHEYQRVAQVLAEQHPQVNLDPILDLLTVEADVVLAPPLPEDVCEDPEDDKFLACAVAAKAQIVISGDKHLLRASGYRDIVVMRPREFMNRYFSGKSGG